MTKIDGSKAFKSGDIVVLKSGSPKMTVDKWSDFHSEYQCNWFVGGKLHSGSFRAESLEAYDEQKHGKKRE